MSFGEKKHNSKTGAWLFALRTTLFSLFFLVSFFFVVAFFGGKGAQFIETKRKGGTNGKGVRNNSSASCNCTATGPSPVISQNQIFKSPCCFKKSYGRRTMGRILPFEFTTLPQEQFFLVVSANARTAHLLLWQSGTASCSRLEGHRTPLKYVKEAALRCGTAHDTRRWRQQRAPPLEQSRR